MIPTGNGDIVISVEGLTVRYGENTILDNVDLQVRRGEVLVIAGGSGCGKSTLLNLISGRLAPDSGSIVVGDTVKDTDSSLPSFVRRRVSKCSMRSPRRSR